MYQKLLFVFISCCLFFSVLSSAQPALITKARKEIYESYLTEDGTRWENACALLETAYLQAKDRNLLYEWTLGLYGLTGFYRSQSQMEEVSSLLNLMEENLEEMLDLDGDWAEANALLGAVLALEMELYPAKAIYLTPISSGYIEEGVELGVRTPVAWTAYGNLRLYAPGLLRSDLDLAIHCYQTSLQLFEELPDQQQYSWVYLQTHISLAKAYEEKGQFHKALEQYLLLQNYESRYQRLNEEIIPKARKKVSR